MSVILHAGLTGKNWKKLTRINFGTGRLVANETRVRGKYISGYTLHSMHDAIIVCAIMWYRKGGVAVPPLHFHPHVFERQGSGSRQRV